MYLLGSSSFISGLSMKNMGIELRSDDWLHGDFELPHRFEKPIEKTISISLDGMMFFYC